MFNYASWDNSMVDTYNAFRDGILPIPQFIEREFLPFTPDIPKADICPYCKQKKKKKRINQQECD